MAEFPYTDEQLRQMFDSVFTASAPTEIVNGGNSCRIVRDSVLEYGIRCCIAVTYLPYTKATFVRVYSEILMDGCDAEFKIDDVIGFDVLAMAKLIDGFKNGGANG